MWCRNLRAACALGAMPRSDTANAAEAPPHAGLSLRLRAARAVRPLLAIQAAERVAVTNRLKHAPVVEQPDPSVRRCCTVGRQPAAALSCRLARHAAPLTVAPRASRLLAPIAASRTPRSRRDQRLEA